MEKPCRTIVLQGFSICSIRIPGAHTNLGSMTPLSDAQNALILALKDSVDPNLYFFNLI